jgi:hypothetical protein
VLGPARAADFAPPEEMAGAEAAQREYTEAARRTTSVPEQHHLRERAARLR